MSRHHVVEASPETIHWGVFDPSLRPILTVESGDSVTFHCVSGGRDAMPPRRGIGVVICLSCHRLGTEGRAHFGSARRQTGADVSHPEAPERCLQSTALRSRRRS